MRKKQFEKLIQKKNRMFVWTIHQVAGNTPLQMTIYKQVNNSIEQKTNEAENESVRFKY